MYKTNKQIAKEIKTSRSKTKTKRFVKKFDKTAEKKEYKESVENYTVILPNI